MIKKLFCAACYFFVSILYGVEQTNCLEFHVIENSPIGFKDNKGNLHGIHSEYLSAIEMLSGLCIDKKLLPYPRVWHGIENGYHDGGIVFKSGSRSELVEYVALIRKVKTVVIPINGVRIKEYGDLSKIIIGKTRGTHLSEQFDNDKNLNIVELNSYDQATQLLKSRRIDAIAGSALALSYQLKKYGVFDEVDIDNKFTLGEKEQWLQLSKLSTQLNKAPQLKIAVGQLKKNGTFDHIMNNYHGKEWQKINK